MCFRCQKQRKKRSKTHAILKFPKMGNLRGKGD